MESTCSKHLKGNTLQESNQFVKPSILSITKWAQWARFTRLVKTGMQNWCRHSQVRLNIELIRSVLYFQSSNSRKPHLKDRVWWREEWCLNPLVYERVIPLHRIHSVSETHSLSLSLDSHVIWMNYPPQVNGNQQVMLHWMDLWPSPPV